MSTKRLTSYADVIAMSTTAAQKPKQANDLMFGQLAQKAKQANEFMHEYLEDTTACTD